MSRFPKMSEAKKAERSAAAEAGEEFYFTGRPCKHGHIAYRRTSNGVCVECEKLNVTDGKRPERKRVKPALSGTDLLINEIFC